MPILNFTSRLTGMRCDSKLPVGFLDLEVAGIWFDA